LTPIVELTPTTPAFDPRSGGVDYGYTIIGGNLPKATSVDLYWAPDSTFDKSKDTLGA
jgi:hypothetical protein